MCRGLEPRFYNISSGLSYNLTQNFVTFFYCVFPSLINLYSCKLYEKVTPAVEFAVMSKSNEEKIKIMGKNSNDTF